MAGSEITNAIAKIVEDEQKVRDAEVDIKSKEGAADRNLWGGRPMMSDYCGLHEKEETYHIWEVKNRGHGCTDFMAAEPARHACADCAYRTTPAGKPRDQKLEEHYNRMVVAAIAVQASPQTPQSLLQSHRGGVAARKALEIGAAYAAKGRMMTPPQYLDYCSHFSTADEYVLCAFQNPHQMCWAWTGTRRS